MGPNSPAGEAEERPPLPPRPSTLASVDPKNLQAQATTAVTPLEIQTLSFPDGSRGTFSTPGAGAVSNPMDSGSSTPRRDKDSMSLDNDDAASVASFAPTMRPAADIASLLGGGLPKRSPAWNLLRTQSSTVHPFEKSQSGIPDKFDDFAREFESLPEDSGEQYGDEERLTIWKSKLKHYMIISAAGKPIWSRHGDLALINSSIGVIHTIISFYEGAKNPLQGFTAGQTRFFVLTQGSLYFVAISKLGESDSQLRFQLEALYMQILSTLTLPTLTHIFANRPSSDLRKPLQGTESLLSSLVDNFTKGSPTALLGSLECLKLRKSQRHTINNTFLKHRTDKLLYGLIVADGKLVSVIRPRRHSLHPSDLQLIFNMLFEAEGVRGGGGENWIPLCLPAFNNRGYLYMYVSFLDEEGPDVKAPGQEQKSSTAQGEVAMVLISAEKESFFELQQMRKDVAQQLAKSGSLAIIRTAARAGRPRVDAIAPGSHISHFLFKSRANVQYCMGSLDALFADRDARRKLMTIYHELHASVHAKLAHLKVLHSTRQDATALAWITPVFEFYCVAGPNMSRAMMTQGANKIIQWTKKEEERLFIIGGGVF